MFTNPLKRYVKDPLTTEVTGWDTPDLGRFAKVTVSDNNLIGWNADGTVASNVPVYLCVGETYDWDAGLTIDCPDHIGVFCPGERKLA